VRVTTIKLLIKFSGMFLLTHASNLNLLVITHSGYAALSGLDDAGQLEGYMGKGLEAMSRMGFLDMMVNESPVS
jgi:hypothetical protein